MRLAVLVLVSASAGFAQMCAPLRALPVGVITGALDDSSCRLSDTTAYAAYRLDLPARGRLDLTLTTDQDFVMALRDASGAAVDSGAAIHRPVEAGAYTLLVNARVPGQVGAYSVQSAFAIEPGMWCTALPLLAVNQKASGKLGAAGCAAPDGTPYDAYAVNTFGAGTLTVTVAAADFTPSITLRTPDHAAAATGDGTVSMPVDGDTRYEVVVSSPDRTGAYDLATSFQPGNLETCKAAGALAGPSTIARAISGDSCAATIPGSGDLQYFDYYTIQVDAAGMANLAVTSADFLPTLYLLDESGNVVAADTGGVDGGSGIRLQLQPGVYTLQLLSSVLSGGSYGLAYDFTAGAPQPCAAGTLDATGSRSGALTGARCRTELGASDLYTVVLPAAGTLDLGLSTDLALTGAIAIRDAKDNLILQATDVQGLGIVRLSADLPAGTYQVVASSVEGAGGYQLTSKFAAHDLAACGYIQPLDRNGGYIKRLSSFSCRGSNGAPVDLFEFTMPADGTAVMVLTSSEMDGYLTLLDDKGSVLRSDDNSYGYGDPMIVQYLPAGTYRLAARSASGVDGGLYEVDVRSTLGPRPLFCGSRQTLAPGASVTGAIAYTGCQSGGAFADVYRVDVPNSGTVDIKLASNDFDAYLVLLDAKGNVVETDDDSGGGTDARITTMLAPGSYYVVARPSTDYTAAGSYTLTVQ
jgi:hypothetical protein